MKKILFLLTFVMSTLAVSANNDTTKDDKIKVQQTVTEYFTALNAGDAAAITALFTPDGEVLPPNAPTASGSDAVRKTYDYVVATFAFALKVSIDKVTVLGDTAILTSTSAGTLTVRADGTVLRGQEFRETFILHRESDKWRIARYMYNSPK